MKSTKRLMKSEREVEEICRKQVEVYLTEKYEAIAQNAAYQAFAVMMCVLNRQYGFGKTRLHRLKNDVESEFVKMKTSFLGRDYSVNDCVKYLKDNYDIDFSKSNYEGWEFDD